MAGGGGGGGGGGAGGAGGGGVGDEKRVSRFCKLGKCITYLKFGRSCRSGKRFAGP